MLVKEAITVILFGGANDGEEFDVDCESEKITVGDNVYADSMCIDDEGREVFYCRSGPGKMKLKFVESLF